MEDRYDNASTKSRILTANNRKDEAAVAQEKALDLATPFQIHSYARQLLSATRQPAMESLAFPHLRAFYGQDAANARQAPRPPEFYQ
jgi:hypothetical protein